MSEITYTSKEIVKNIQGEIDFHRATIEAGEYKAGFIAGLKHVQEVFKLAEKQITKEDLE